MTEVNPQWQTAPYKVSFCFGMLVIRRPGWSRKRLLKVQRRARKKAIAHYKKSLNEMVGRMTRRIESSVFDRTQYAGESDVAIIGAELRPLAHSRFFWK